MVELHQHSYTLMSHSKALWDTFSRSRKHSRCRKHSSNRCNSNNGNTNIPKTRRAVFQTSEICWRGSAMNCDGVPRSLCVLSLCRWQHVVALGSQAWRPMLQRECLKNVDVKPLVRSVPMQESLEWKTTSRGCASPPSLAATWGGAGPSSPACATSPAHWCELPEQVDHLSSREDHNEES